MRGHAKYQLVAEIGRGGMADVFLAVRRRGTKLDEKVVIKQLRSDVAEDEDFKAMFIDEARLSVRLVHPNVVRTFEAGREGARCYIVMEFLDGQPLSRVRRRGRQGGKLPLDIHLRILSEVLAGLHYVHELTDSHGMPLGIVHRDVTPPNVFVSYEGDVKVVDFGIAKAATRLVETRMGVLKGKISYMAPEHARGDNVDRRSDIFSVGVMLWEAVKGRRFWQGHDELSIYRRLLADDLPELGSDDVGHKALLPIIERALAVDMNKRYRTAAEMREAIEGALREMGSRVSRRAVSRFLRDLFERERVAFDTAVYGELLRLRAGKKRPMVPVLNEPAPPPLLRESSGSLTPALADPSPRSADGEMVDFRSHWSFLRSVAWLTLGFGLALAAWLGLRRADDERDLRPVVELGAQPALPRPPPPPAPFVPIPPRTELEVKPMEPEPATAPVSSVTPAPVKVATSSAASARARPAPAKAISPAPADELKKAPRPRGSVDEEDPWAR
jgi:serine/threonine-protein kinase